MRSFPGITVLLRLALVPVLALTAVAAPAGPAAADDKTAVIVQKLPGAGNGPEESTKKLGGEVGLDLSVIDAFTATVPSASVARLTATAGVAHVTPDEPVRLHGLLGGLLGGGGGGSEQAPANAPIKPVATENVYQESVGIDKVQDAGVTGKGSVVALVDTGVSDLPELKGSLVTVKDPKGRERNCLDLSGEKTCNDSYGHGTFLAGLITGSGNSEGDFRGVAPDSKVLSIKIAGRDGSASVGKIIYAIQWVKEHKDEHGIDVLNLSLGTDSTQSYRFDPLNKAVEEAWDSGVSVVVAAGNRGPGGRTISKPADDPLVITAGAIDDMTTAATDDDILPDFSSKGPTAADNLTKPDLVAPGGSLISLRSPGSAIEEKFPTGVDVKYRRGSGTSQSAAVVSGAVALLHERRPDASPDEVKFALTNSTSKVASEDRNAVGRGLLDVDALVSSTPEGKANQGVARSNGLGSLRDSQGTIGVIARDGDRALGLIESILRPRDGDARPDGGSWYGTGWLGGSWYGGSWYGGSWYGKPAGGSWYGGSWYGGSWYGGSWYGGSWYGGSWYGGSWYGAWG